MYDHFQHNYNIKLPLNAISNGTEYEKYCEKAQCVYENIRIYFEDNFSFYFKHRIEEEYKRISKIYHKEHQEERIRSFKINNKLYEIYKLHYTEGLTIESLIIEDVSYEESLFYADLLTRNNYTLNCFGYYVLKAFVSIRDTIIDEKVKPLTFYEHTISEYGEAFLSTHYDPIRDMLITYCLYKNIKIFILDGKIAIQEPTKELKKDLSDKEAEQLLSNILGYPNIICGNSEKADIGPFNLISFHSTYKPNIKKMFYTDEVTGKNMYNSYFEHRINAIASTIEDEDCKIIDDFFNHICEGEKESNHVKNQLKVSIKTGIARACKINCVTSPVNL